MDREAIEVNAGRFTTALERGDAAEMAACYASDAILLPPGYPCVAGREAIEAFWDGGVAAGLRGMRFETLTLEIIGETALEVGRSNVLVQPPDAAAVADVGKYVVVHKRQADGAWKWAVDIFNFDSERWADA